MSLSIGRRRLLLMLAGASLGLAACSQPQPAAPAKPAEPAKPAAGTTPGGTFVIASLGPLPKVAHGFLAVWRQVRIS